MPFVFCEAVRTSIHPHSLTSLFPYYVSQIGRNVPLSAPRVPEPRIPTPRPRPPPSPPPPSQLVDVRDPEDELLFSINQVVGDCASAQRPVISARRSCVGQPWAASVEVNRSRTLLCSRGSSTMSPASQTAMHPISDGPGMEALD